MTGQNGRVAKQRGRESIGDMVRSLGIVLAIVLVVFLLGRPPGSDESALRVVDASGDVQAFAQEVRGVSVPGRLPAGWRSTVSSYRFGSGQLRVGWVTPRNQYAEYAASTGPPGPFLRDITGNAPRTGTVTVGGTRWTEYRSGRAISLVRRDGPATVVLGTVRDTASLDELRVLAGSLTP